MQIPREEHPRPQFRRERWQNLNGLWQFEVDNGRSGEARGLMNPGVSLAGAITVPFCPESRLSGVQNTDFMAGVWYKRTVAIDEESLTGTVYLHFGAVDYTCRVYVNGKLAGTHRGGYTSFRFDVTALAVAGENEIAVYAEDDTRDPLIPSGKQSSTYGSRGCYYTRTTGIWQTVWLEFAPKAHINSVHYETNPESGLVVLTVQLCGVGDFTAQAFYEGTAVGQVSLSGASGRITLSMPLSEIHLWEPGAGRLYDVALTFGEDRVSSYFGLRSIRLDGYKFLINGKSVFQRLILDQGFYPDGIYTAPTDAALAGDIDMSMAMGFNGARPHEKIFEERYLYHCDRKGYLVWGEYPSWGLDHASPQAIYSILPEWLEELERDRNHPSIVGWCPFNETWDLAFRKQYDDLLRSIYRVTKAVDPVRPCIDTSGNFHVETDVFDLHDYCQDPAAFHRRYDALATDGTLCDRFALDSKNARYAGRQVYGGQPVFMSEFGGIRWAGGENDRERKQSWGYGTDPVNLADFQQRFQGLCDALLDNPCMFGFCYTQLTDVEQEQNGLYTYQRQAKFDPAWVRSVVSRKAAIED